VDWSAAAEDEVTAAALDLQRQANRLAAAQLDVLAAVDRRGLHLLDGAVTTASWFRNRTGIDPATAARMCNAARRLAFLPHLAAALADGDITLAHVTAVTSSAVPRRQDVFANADETLAELCRSATPTTVRQAVKFLCDQVDDDGSDAPPLDEHGKDERRYHDQWGTVDGMLEYRGICDPADGELLRSVLDAFDKPDPPDTPPERRRSPGQRRADALAAAMQAAAGSPEAPTVHGAKPHILGMLDLAKWLGRPDLATFADQLRYTGDVDLYQIDRLLDDAAFTAVLTLGPWRVVNVGRTQRTLPNWLRPLLQMLHRHCRGPDCDRPATWAQAHHQTDWSAGGDTDLNATVPVCDNHHDMLTNGGWTVHLDLETGVCIWTSPDGRPIEVPP
jgi:hypothetical protein